MSSLDSSLLYELSSGHALFQAVVGDHENWAPTSTASFWLRSPKLIDIQPHFPIWIHLSFLAQDDVCFAFEPSFVLLFFFFFSFHLIFHCQMLRAETFFKTSTDTATVTGCPKGSYTIKSSWVLSQRLKTVKHPSMIQWFSNFHTPKGHYRLCYKVDSQTPPLEIPMEYVWRWGLHTSSLNNQSKWSGLFQQLDN